MYHTQTHRHWPMLKVETVTCLQSDSVERDRSIALPKSMSSRAALAPSTRILLGDPWRASYMKYTPSLTMGLIRSAYSCTFAQRGWGEVGLGVDLHGWPSWDKVYKWTRVWHTLHKLTHAVSKPCQVKRTENSHLTDNSWQHEKDILLDSKHITHSSQLACWFVLYSVCSEPHGTYVRFFQT